MWSLGCFSLLHPDTKDAQLSNIFPVWSGNCQVNLLAASFLLTYLLVSHLKEKILHILMQGIKVGKVVQLEFKKIW